MNRAAARGLALVVGGSDPSGGAGLELSLKVHALFGVHAAAVASCTTLQSARGVRTVTPAAWPPAARQLAELRRCSPIAVVQVGMVADARWVAALARLARELRGTPFVADPVFAPTRGPRALAAREVAAWRRELLPAATLLTPNALEAAELLGWPLARVRAAPDEAARALVALGAHAVLLKGGHLGGRGAIVDRLRGALGSRDWVQSRQAGPPPRGTGCALAAAIAAGVARGRSWSRAIGEAQRWLARARRGASRIGSGRRYLALSSARGDRGDGRAV